MASNHKAIGTARRLLRDRRGLSSVEFALVSLLFFGMVFGVIDFSRAMWEWNAAAKATHWGARYAIVNDMVSIKLAEFSGVLAGVDAGSSVDAGTVVTELGTDTFTCNNTGCNGNGNTTEAFNDIAFGLIVLLVSVYTVKPLEFAIFPTVLLVATLLRLALNVASTRVIMLDGHEGTGAAGRVIQAFGEFVVGGNYAVGLIVFASGLVVYITRLPTKRAVPEPV